MDGTVANGPPRTICSGRVPTAKVSAAVVHAATAAVRLPIEVAWNLVARRADGSRFQFIAATLDHLVSDLVDHFLDEQAQVTSTTEI